MLKLLYLALIFLSRWTGLDEPTRFALNQSTRVLGNVWIAVEPRVIIYRVDRIRVYDDAIDFDAEMGFLSRKPLVPGENELIFQVGRLSILDRKGCLWQLGKDERNPPLIHFAPWKDQKKAFLMPGDETSAECSFGRGWELRDCPTHFLPARIHPGPARVLNHSRMTCHTFNDEGEPVGRCFVTVVFGEPEVSYMEGKTPRTTAVRLVTK